VPAGSALEVVVGPDPTLDTTLSLSLSAAACAVRQCVGTVTDAPFMGGTDIGKFANTTSTAQTVLVVVAGAPAGTFTLSVTFNTAVRETCASAQSIGRGTFLNQTFLSGNDYVISPPGTCEYRDGPDVAYVVNAAPGSTLEVTATPRTPMLSVAVVLSTAAQCGTQSCLSSNVSPAPNAPARARAQVGPSGQLYVIVDSAVIGSTGALFDLTIQEVSSVPTTMALCTMAPILTDGAFVPLQPGPFNQTLGVCFAAGPEAVRQLTVPPFSTVRLDLRTASNEDLRVSAFSSVGACTAASCSGTQQVDSPGSSAETINLANPNGSPQTFFVLLEAVTNGTSAFVQASVTTLAIGESCNLPLSVPNSPPSVRFSDTFAGRQRDHQPSMGPACSPYSGPDIVYALPVQMVPRRYQATMTTSGPDVVLNVILGTAAQCSVSGCTASADATRGATETVVFDVPAGERAFLIAGLATPGSVSFTLGVAALP
jgi:hypothetical protein